MDIYTLNRAKTIQERLKSLNWEKEIWENASDFCTGVEVWSNGSRYEISTSLIDFKELRNRTLTYINSKIEELEKEFEKL